MLRVASSSDVKVTKALKKATIKKEKASLKIRDEVYQLLSRNDKILFESFVGVGAQNGDLYRVTLTNLMTERGEKNRTLKAALRELKGLDRTAVTVISYGFNRDDVIGFDSFELYVLVKLRLYGLTADHLRARDWSRNDSDDFTPALISLMSGRGSKNRKAEEAIKELRGLSWEQASGIARGMSREEVIHLDYNKIEAYLALQQNGLTIDQLRACQWHADHTLGRSYRDALLRLVRVEKKSVTAALADLEGLGWQQARAVADGLSREVVLLCENSEQLDSMVDTMLRP